MEPRLVYWTWALINMTFAVGCAFEGVRRIRRREIRPHRRLMITAGSLVALFVISYGFKLSFLGREDLASWSEVSIQLLRIHETCVLVMLISGGYAASLAFRFHREGSAVDTHESATDRMRQRHRRAGWIAVVASALGVLTAAVVLQGMYGRAAPPKITGSHPIAAPGVIAKNAPLAELPPVSLQPVRE